MLNRVEICNLRNVFRGVKSGVGRLEKVYQGRLSTALQNDMPYWRGQSKRMLKGWLQSESFGVHAVDIEFELSSQLTPYSINFLMSRIKNADGLPTLPLSLCLEDLLDK